MTVKVKIKHIVENQIALAKVSNKTLPAVIAFRISKAMRKINDEMAVFEDFRINLIKNNGTETSQGNWTVIPSKSVEVSKQVDKLLDEEFEIDISPIDIKEFEKVEISPAELLAISFMIDGEL